MKRPIPPSPAALFPNRFIFFDGPSARARGKKSRDEGTRRREHDGGEHDTRGCDTRGGRTTEGAAPCSRAEATECGSLPFAKKGETRGPSGLFPKAGTRAKGRAPFRRQGKAQGFGTGQKCGAGNVAGLLSLHGEGPVPPLPGDFPGADRDIWTPTGSSRLRPGASPRPERKKRGGALPAAPGRHTLRIHVSGPRRSTSCSGTARRTAADDAGRVRTRLNAGRPEAAVCLYRHARGPIVFPAARKARAGTAPR